jgi:hypothetical protein
VIRNVELKSVDSNGTGMVEIIDTGTAPGKEIDINCKHRLHEKYESISLPSKLTPRNISFEFDSESSVMDGSCSNHSILDELRMQEYEDPYKEFVRKIALKRIEEKIEEVETDVLTQLPSIKKQFSQKQIRKKRTRRYTIQNSSTSIQPTVTTKSSTCLSSNADSERYNNKQSEGCSSTLETQSMSGLREDNIHSANTYQNVQLLRKHIYDGENMLKQKSSVSLTYNTDQFGTKDINVHRVKVSKISSVPSSSPSVDERLFRMVAQNGEIQNLSVRKVPRQRRATIQTSTNGTYHGRLEL